MAEAFAVVKVGKSEWLLAKLTPCSRIENMVGESTAFTEPARRPSKTKIKMLRRGSTDLSWLETNAEQSPPSARAATSHPRCLFIAVSLPSARKRIPLQAEMLGPSRPPTETRTLCFAGKSPARIVWKGNGAFRGLDSARTRAGPKQTEL